MVKINIYLVKTVETQISVAAGDIRQALGKAELRLAEIYRDKYDAEIYKKISDISQIASDVTI